MKAVCVPTYYDGSEFRNVTVAPELLFQLLRVITGNFCAKEIVSKVTETVLPGR